MPFPVEFVIVFFQEDRRGTSHAGTYFILPAGQDSGHEPDNLLSPWARQLSRYYWRDHRTWISEGTALFMMTIKENGRAGLPRMAFSYPCPDPRSIAKLEGLDPHAITTLKGNLSLGERLFLDLYYTLGDTAFREGFRNLYLMPQDNQIGISQIEEAFKAGAPDLTVLVDAIVGRWYYGTEDYDTSHLDRGPVDPDLPSISGRIDSAHLALNQGGQPILSFSGQGVTGPVWLSIDYSRAAGWEQHELELEVVDSFEDGFMFRRREMTLRTTPGRESSSHHISVGYTEFQRSTGTEPGRYWVYVYHEGRKVAEVEYEVTE